MKKLFTLAAIAVVLLASCSTANEKEEVVSTDSVAVDSTTTISVESDTVSAEVDSMLAK